METMSASILTTSPTPISSSLYYSVVPEDERFLYERAATAVGLDDEICLLRVKLACIVRDDPSNMKLFLRAIAVFERLSRTNRALFHHEDSRGISASVVTTNSPVKDVEKPPARRTFTHTRKARPGGFLPDPTPQSTTHNPDDSPSVAQESAPIQEQDSPPLLVTADVNDGEASIAAAIAIDGAGSTSTTLPLGHAQNQPRPAHHSIRADRKHKKKQKRQGRH